MQGKMIVYKLDRISRSLSEFNLERNTEPKFDWEIELELSR